MCNIGSDHMKLPLFAFKQTHKVTHNVYISIQHIFSFEKKKKKKNFFLNIVL